MQTPRTKHFSLPFEIEIEVSAGKANIESELGRAIPGPPDNSIENARVVGVIEGMEQLLMSLALAGIDLSAPEFSAALRDCVARLQA
ncbi:hypothetical protein CS8_090310 [Cupriavidus sp. 8B]